jgi:hypothetical protein
MCLAALVGLSACQRSTQLAVRAVAESGDEEVARQQEIIRLLPFDRDSLFTALAALATESEPEPPEYLVALRDSVSAARQLWTDSEAAWNDMRSEMQTLSEQMNEMNRASREYANAYRRFDELDRQIGRLERAKDNFFDTFTGLQDAYRTSADSFNAVLEAWGDRAFERYGEIVDSIIEVRGEEMEDTTDAGGWAYFTVPRGTWWVYTRTTLVFEELYWNYAYESEGGVDTLVLRASNAEVRPVF